MVPALATLTGRKALPINGNNIKSQNYFTVLANRRYVDERLFDLLIEVGTDFQGLEAPETRKILYLDANFPFFDGFPLLPHLSHDDGKKVDLCLRYRTISDDRISNKVPGIIGYGVYEEPKPGEVETTPVCKASNRWYNASRIFGFRTDVNPLVFDEQETKKLIEILVRKDISKLFIEPHLKHRLGLTSNKVRFHGCHAVRHDDHIHVEIQ
jgi:murein endopeptidase